MRSTAILTVTTVLLLVAFFLLKPFAFEPGSEVSHEAPKEVRRLVLLANYISGDYKEAVSPEGTLVNKDEYEEMLEFAGTMSELYGSFEGFHEGLLSEMLELKELIKGKKDPKLVKKKSVYLAKELKKKHSLVAFLHTYPDLQRGKFVYESQCASCHGVSGDGKTPIAKALDPPPRNLIEKEFYEDLSPSRVHNTLKLGISGTSMFSYENILSEEDKWHVSFYVTSMPFNSEKEKQLDSDFLSLLAGKLSWSSLADMSHKDLTAWLAGQGLEASLSHDIHLASFPEKSLPLKLEKKKSVRKALTKSQAGLAYAKDKLGEARSEFELGNIAKLSGIVLDAYLEGFEEFEKELKALAPGKLKELEKRFMNLRLFSNPKNFEEKQFEGELSVLQLELEKLNSVFTKKIKRSGSAFSEFVSSLTIIVREGLEAFLIVMALLALVGNLGVHSGKKWIHAAWVSAVILGFATYWLMNKVFELSGASRELLEAGLTGFAVLMLFYTGFWLLSQSGSKRWAHFVKGESENTLSQGNLWTFFALAFIAVYREAAETVLFYGALFSTASSPSFVLFGFFAGVFLLLALCLGLLYYNIKIPLDKFFKMTSSLMFVLSFVLMGKAVYELIESGLLKGTYLQSIPRFEAFGIYPFLETLLAQGILLIVTIALLLKFNSTDDSKKGKPLGRGSHAVGA